MAKLTIQDSPSLAGMGSHIGHQHLKYLYAGIALSRIAVPAYDRDVTHGITLGIIDSINGGGGSCPGYGQVVEESVAARAYSRCERYEVVDHRILEVCTLTFGSTPSFSTNLKNPRGGFALELLKHLATMFGVVYLLGLFNSFPVSEVPLSSVSLVSSVILFGVFGVGLTLPFSNLVSIFFCIALHCARPLLAFVNTFAVFLVVPPGPFQNLILVLFVVVFAVFLLLFGGCHIYSDPFRRPSSASRQLADSNRNSRRYEITGPGTCRSPLIHSETARGVTPTSLAKSLRVIPRASISRVKTCGVIGTTLIGIRYIVPNGGN